MPFRGEDAELAVDLREDERELADLGEASADDERGPDGVAEGQDDARRHKPLADHDQRDDRRDEERLADDERRIEEHADRNEEEHREGVAQRQRLGGGLMAEVGFADRDAREERAERERDLERERGHHRDAERHDEDRKREELAVTGPRDLLEKPRDHARADRDHEDAEEGDLRERNGEPEHKVVPAGTRGPAQDRSQRR